MRARYFPDTQDDGHRPWVHWLAPVLAFIVLGVKVLAPAVGFLFIGAFEAAET